MEDGRLQSLRDRTEKLKAAKREGAAPGAAADASGETPGRENAPPPGPPRASDDWRRFYGAVRDAVERLRR